MMKCSIFSSKFLMLGVNLFFAAVIVANNYQPLNPGFEGQWDAKTNEPEHWHGFATANANGLFAMAKNANQLQPSTDEVHSGSYAALIKAKQIKIATVSITAQGNITTGRINGGSIKPEDANGNYNYLDPAETDYQLPFSGKPDSMVVWTKFVPDKNTEASIGCQLIRNMRYQTPTTKWTVNDTEVTHKDVVIAEAINDHITAQTQWTRLSIPFVYDQSGDTPVYALITATTNNTPGKGGATDKMYLDDFMMIYNSELVSVTVDGNTFEADTVIHTGIIYNGKHEVTNILTNAQAATTEYVFDDTQRTATIMVKGNDYSVNNANVHTYRLTFLAQPTELNDVTDDADRVMRIVRNGQVLIQRNGFTFDLFGRIVR